MEIAIISGGICLVIGGIGGYMLATHIHSVAAAATTAVTRATTIPAGDVATLNSAITGLGTAVAANTAAVGTATNAAVAKAVTASSS